MNTTDKCYGMCLAQADEQGSYYKIKNCENNCQPQKCPNYELCGVMAPKWVFDCHSDRCWNCNMFFGTKLEIVEHLIECPICLEDKKLVARWECTHLLCLECFRKNNGWNGDVFMQEGKIVLKNESEDNIVSGNESEDNISENESVEETEYPEYIGKCPICRHEAIN